MEFVSCNLSRVVTLDIRDNAIVNLTYWQPNSMCCGKRGIFPRAYNMRSICVGPVDCTLLKEGMLLYPPDRNIWLPILELDIWNELMVKFQTLPAEYSDNTNYILERQRLWQVGPFRKMVM